MKANAIKIGGHYNWIGQPDRLIYLGQPSTGPSRGWHQFKKIGDPRAIWCEVLNNELRLIEETKPQGDSNG